MALTVEESVGWLRLLHEVSQISGHHRCLVHVLRAIQIAFLVADGCVACTHLARGHHLAVVVHLFLSHAHIFILLIILLLSWVSLCRLVVHFHPCLQCTFICGLMPSLVRWLRLLLARLLLVECLVVLQWSTLRPFLLLHLIPSFPFPQALATTDPVVEVRSVGPLMLSCLE